MQPSVQTIPFLHLVYVTECVQCPKSSLSILLSYSYFLHFIINVHLFLTSSLLFIYFCHPLLKAKVKSLYLTKHHAIKAYWRSGGIAPRIPDLGTRWRVSGQLHALSA
jgi:hypothetical protein